MISTVEAPAKARLLKVHRSKPRASGISQALEALSKHEKAAHPHTTKFGYLVRPVETPREMDEVYRLTHDAYVERGYCPPKPDGRLRHYVHLGGIPETTVLVVPSPDTSRVVGTVTVTTDGPAGLHCDGDFKDACDRVRSEDRRICSVWRIVTRHDTRNEGRVVMALIQAAIDTAFDRLKCQTMLCTFNPRHERFYARACAMETIARSEGTEGLQQAPAVLMRLYVENIPARWRRRES